MLSRISAIAPDSQTTNQCYAPEEMPTPWCLHKLNHDDVANAQKIEFSQEIIEASQDLDDSSYVIQNNILYSIAEPYCRAGRYPRLVLPEQYRKMVIERCHEEVGHQAFLKTLMKVQESYVWPGMRKSV